MAMKPNRTLTEDAKLLTTMDELRSLKKDYRDLHSVKDDLFNVTNRPKDREPELCEHLWQVCLLVHERCEAIYRLMLDLKEDTDKSYADSLVQEADEDGQGATISTRRKYGLFPWWIDTDRCRH